MTTYSDDWERLRGELPTAVPLVHRLSEFWTTPTLAESAYFVVLGHAARNTLGAAAARNAVRAAVERLQTTGLENARAAIDIEVTRCLEAITELRGDRNSASAYVELVAGRESIEGLRVLLRFAQFDGGGTADLEQSFAELFPFVDGVAQEVDATVERLGLASRQSATPLKFLGDLKHFRSIAESHPDDWWNALVLFGPRREAIEEAGAQFKDEYADLVDWVPTLRNRRWRTVRDVERLTKELARWIDASYKPRNPKRAARALRILWDASSDLLEQLAQRTTRGEIVRWIAQGVTLTLTLYDRVLGLVRPAARVPSDLQRLGWAAHAWRLARLLQYRDGELVVNAFRRHSMWQSSQLELKYPDAVAAGCVAASWYVAQTGYRDEANVWLGRAEMLIRSGKGTDVEQRLVTIADGCSELAALYLQEPEQPDVSIGLCSHAIQLTDECSADASQSDRCVAARIRAMLVRAAACDQTGEFLLALDERNAALRHLEDPPATLSPYALMEMRRGLHLACGDVDSAEQVMVAYIKTADTESAGAVAFSRSTMLLDYGYNEAGIKALQELASQKRPARWISRARALLGSMRSFDSNTATDRKDPWKLEANAQAAFREARRLAGTPAAKACITAALRENDKLLRLKAADLIGLTRKAQLLIQRGSDADLKRASETLDRLDHEDPYVLFCRGHLAFKRHDFVGAASWLREAYELSPRAQTAVLLAQSLSRSQQLNAALEVVNAADSVEDDAPLLDTRGIILAGLGQHVNAWSSFEQACTALNAGRALRPPLHTEGPPRRTLILCRRMASLAPHVARKQPASIERFLKRNADAANTFISSCVSRLAFEPALRDVILGAGRNPALHKSLAHYAMGACVYEDTMGRPDEVPRILETLWTALDLRHNRSLIAELLAGGKSAYVPSIRSALEGAAAATRLNAKRWIAVQPSSRWDDITQHIATTRASATYYRDTSQLVDKHPELWSSVDALIEHVRRQIPAVRLSNLEQRRLTEVLPRLDVDEDNPAYLEALVESGRRIGPDRAIVSTTELKLYSIPPFLVDVTPWTVRLAVRFAGTPTDYKVLQPSDPAILQNDEPALTVRVVFNGAEWPTSLRGLLKTEGLIPANGQRSIMLPIEATNMASIPN